MNTLSPLSFRAKWPFLLVAAAGLLSLSARADEAMTLTVPAIPPGGNPAAVAAPKVDWVIRSLASDSRANVQQPPVELVFDGDSITDGWQGGGKAVWAKNYGALHAFDFGISGDRTEHVLWRLEHGQAAGLKPKLIALMIGTNNLSRDKDEQIAAGIEAIVHEYRQRFPEAVVLLQAIFPRGEHADDPLRARIKNINGMIAKLGDGKKVIFVDFGDKFLQPDGTLPKDIMPDSLHPNAKGYEIWADAIRPVVEQVFGKTPAS